MRISRVHVQNFRNFRELDVCFGDHAVVVGENKVGKSNLIHALRLVLDPSLPDSARFLRPEDFWDGLPRPLTRDHQVAVEVDLTDFNDNPAHLCLLGDCLVDPDTMTARLTYLFRPKLTLEGDPRRDADYEWLIYGGGEPENHIRGDVRRRLPMDVLPALRDAEAALANWRKSPLRPLVEEVAAAIDREELIALAERFTDLGRELATTDHVRQLATAITNRMRQMAGQSHSVAMQLGIAPTDPDRLVRTLRLYIDEGQRSIGDASLGSANLLFLTLKQLELEQLADHDSRDHTFLAIEEPEAHLHPHLQRLVYRDFLRSRAHIPDGVGDGPDAPDGDLGERAAITKIMTTHSPHIVSVSPVRSLVHLRKSAEDGSTVAASTSLLDLTDAEVADLERYLDVTRGEIVFARGVLLVEGEAETYLVPALAKSMDMDLDELGITVCSVAGTNFAPYMKFLGPNGLDLPHAVITDLDPQEDGSNLGCARANRLLPLTVRPNAPPIVPPGVDSPDFIHFVAHHGIFLNTHTLEIDLFHAGQHEAMLLVLGDLTSNGACQRRVDEWREDPGRMEPTIFLGDVAEIGKGRFAQRLAACLMPNACPDYILEAIRYVARQCA